MSAAPRIPPALCPECFYRMDAATAADGTPDAPTPGDVSICLNCGQLLIFDAELVLVKPSRDQVADLMNNQKHWTLLERLRYYIHERGRFQL